ncbi:30S ribosomal protein S3 [uncultured archaeon]|nr:30S ribosomal protein S3 [uncultured archaeon]
MEERKFVGIRKEEYGVKEFIKREFGKGKVSSVKVEYTPVGEKVIISTHKPGLIIGKKGETIEKLTETLKKRFKMENPHVDIAEIAKPGLDAQLVADDIALAIERFGSMRFKAVAYKALMKIKGAGALGAELVMSGRLPSERAKTWRFKYGYLRKTGDESNNVSYAESVGADKQGVIGIKVSILAPNVITPEEISITEDLIGQIKKNILDEKAKSEIKSTKKVKK